MAKAPEYSEDQLVGINATALLVKRDEQGRREKNDPNDAYIDKDVARQLLGACVLTNAGQGFLLHVPKLALRNAGLDVAWSKTALPTRTFQGTSFYEIDNVLGVALLDRLQLIAQCTYQEAHASAVHR